MDQFFYQMWRREYGQIRFQMDNVMIPHTIMFNCGQPTKWFFTSKAEASFGEFQKKRRKNATSEQILNEITKQRKHRVTDIVAYYVTGQRYKDRNGNNQAALPSQPQSHPPLRP